LLWKPFKFSLLRAEPHILRTRIDRSTQRKNGIHESVTQFKQLATENNAPLMLIETIKGYQLGVNKWYPLKASKA
jgi:hypothetical protein